MKPTVILLHGLGRTARSMSRLRRALDAAGYPTWAPTYPSRRAGLEELSDLLADRITRETADREVVGVTHSLGGILARHVADRVPWRSLVMIAPPNAGSRAARALHRSSAVRFWFGPSTEQLGAAERWPDPPCPVGVIAGTTGLHWANPTSWVTAAMHLFDGAAGHDGTVALEETHVRGMSAFATVASTHTWIMRDPRTVALALHFLEHGEFPGAPEKEG